MAAIENWPNYLELCCYTTLNAGIKKKIKEMLKRKDFIS